MVTTNEFPCENMYEIFSGKHNKYLFADSRDARFVRPSDPQMFTSYVWDTYSGGMWCIV